MNSLTLIAEAAMLLSPGDAAAKNVAAMLDGYAKAAGLSAQLRDTAVAGAKLAKKVATKKATAEDLQALLNLLSQLERDENQAAGSSVTADLVAEYLATQGSVLEDFEEATMNLTAQGEAGLRALRRQVHTWKGETGIIGVDELARELHKIEDALDNIPVDRYPQVTDALLELKDNLGVCFTALRNGGSAKLNTQRILDLMTGVAQDIDVPPIADTLPAAVAEPEAAPVAAADPANELPYEQRRARLSGTSGDNFVIPSGVDTELVGEFRNEADEHFQNIELGLMNLESAPDDLESVNNVFRAFHTVKGVASFVGINYITELAHKAENLLDRVRKGTLALEGPFVDLAFESMDLLRRMIQSLPNAVAEGSYPVPPNYAALLYRLEHPEEVRAAFHASGGAAARAEQAAAEEQAAAAAEADSETVAAPAAGGERKSDAQAAPTDATVKVNMSRLDALINMVGERVIAQAMVSQDPDISRSNNRKLVQNVAQLAKITRSLQELALSMRMVSVKPTFQKMARLVRDVARKSNKIVEFEMCGDDTELDRNMVEAIADPLVHMVRNAVDHGVEPPDVRIAAGKTRHGLVTLSAEHEGGSVVRTLRDDGRGLNRDKILSKAIERGIIDPTAQMTDREIYNLIFLPGFSTADKITDVSGRGVGMDVVRTNIEKLRGSVEIDSTPGEGSVFRVRLPLTLAIIDGMVIRAGSQRFIIPTIAITESLRPVPQDVVTVHGRGELVKLRGALLPVCRLHNAFEIADANLSLTESILVVAEAKANRVAIMADALLGQQQVVIKSLGQMFDGMPGVAGCAILGDGRISLILDIEGLLRVSQATAGSRLETEVPA